MSFYGPLNEVDTAFADYLAVKMKISCFRGQILDLTDELKATPVNLKNRHEVFAVSRKAVALRDKVMQALTVARLLQEAIVPIKVMLEKGNGEYNVRFFFPFFFLVNETLGILDAMEETRHELTTSMFEVDGYLGEFSIRRSKIILHRIRLDDGHNKFLCARAEPLDLPIYGGTTPLGDIEAALK